VKAGSDPAHSDHREGVMKTMKKLGQGMLVAIGVLGLVGVASAGPKTITSCKTIDEPGSYLVTKNLTANGDCLKVAVAGVTIDLGGWVLTGNGTGVGIQDLYAGAQATVVRNGMVRGFDDGIALSQGNNIIEHVRVLNSASVGISVGPGSLVKNSVVSNSATFGIGLSCPASAIGNTVTNNGLDDNIIMFGAGCVSFHNLAP
jgi:hypothetical protein